VVAVMMSVTVGRRAAVEWRAAETTAAASQAAVGKMGRNQGRKQQAKESN
jgi:hypothetical protein